MVNCGDFHGFLAGTALAAPQDAPTRPAQGRLYGCDAALSPGGKPSGSQSAGWVFRID
jgi:hypothetical protein